MRILPAEYPQTVSSLRQPGETPGGTLKENLSRPHPKPLGTVNAGSLALPEDNRRGSHWISHQLSLTCGFSEQPE